MDDVHDEAGHDPEVAALASLVGALEPLDSDSRRRVIDYAVERYYVNLTPEENSHARPT